MDIQIENLSKQFTEAEIGKAFGSSLKKLRTHLKLSLNAFGALVDIPNPTINRYENGINIPAITQALKLAEFFHLSIEEMIFLGWMKQETSSNIIKRKITFKRTLKRPFFLYYFSTKTYFISAFLKALPFFLSLQSLLKTPLRCLPQRPSKTPRACPCLAK